MSIFLEKDHRTGRTHWVVSQYWPDGGRRFRRRCPDESTAIALDLKIRAAIANNAWIELRRQLTAPPPPKPVTVKEFEEPYMKHCKLHNRRPEFKTHNLKAIVRIVGHVPLAEFSHDHAELFVQERQEEEVSNATINRGLSVLRDMLSYAIRKRIITINPLRGFGELPETEKEPRFMTVQEERSLVNAVMAEDHLVGIFCGILGETGLRLSDGLRLQWSQLDRRRKQMSKLTSKGNRVVHVPLSDYAMELLNQVTRVVGCPYVFVRLGEKEPIARPREQLKRARKKVGLEWVGFHDFRHYRGSQWAMHGVDLKTIQVLLGHEDIETTMRYAHFAQSHATQAVMNAQRQEQTALAAETEAAGNK